MSEKHLALHRFDNHSPLALALRTCEIHCESMCCGMNAYEVSPDQFQLWADTVDHATLDAARQQVAEILAELDGAPDTVKTLGHVETRDETREWFEKIAASLAVAKAGKTKF